LLNNLAALSFSPKWASEARSKQSCPKAPNEQLAALAAVRRTVQPLKVIAALLRIASRRSWLLVLIKTTRGPSVHNWRLLWRQLRTKIFARNLW